MLLNLMENLVKMQSALQQALVVLRVDVKLANSSEGKRVLALMDECDSWIARVEALIAADRESRRYLH